MKHSERKPVIGIALGGGGVRGVAHLSILAVLDKLGIKPDYIAGTSMGAIIGSLYAAGVSAWEIRSELWDHVITKEDTLKTVYEKRKKLVKWFDAFRIELGTGGVVRTDKFLGYLFEEVNRQSFEELEIPLTVVAADFWNGEEVRLTEGDLLTAVRASMAVPGVFTPVEMNGRLLVDGGIVNQVPYNVFADTCDITIAVDVTGIRTPTKETMSPTPRDSLWGSFEILQEAQLRERYRHCKPDILVKPPLENINILEFDRMEDVFSVSDETAKEFQKELELKLEEFHKAQRNPILDLLPRG